MLLVTEGLCKSFDNTQVLKNVSFNVNAGEIVSLIGKSGAGKTTVLRLITGLETCDKGTICIDGKYLCKYDNDKMTYASKSEIFDIRKNMSMVFQNYHLFPHMTVIENVTLALTEVYRRSKSEASEIALNILKKLDMEQKVHFKPFELSGGQKQRVAIARSCVTSPKLICFDEPTAALDSALIVDIINIIKALAKEGMGVLIISHDEKFVRDVSDRILFMENGEIVKEMDSNEYSNIMRA